MTDVSERFKHDTATHEMTVARDDGPYRHLKFWRRVTDKETGRTGLTSTYWFDLITWPGHFTITGDCGTFVFAREDDMFEFFRGKNHGWISPDYWSEKLRAPEPAAARRYSEDAFRRAVFDRVAADIRDGRAPRGIGRAVRQELFEDYRTSSEDGAHAALAGFEFEGYRFPDSWEMHLREYDWMYLWCCHAIVWGIAQYDKQKVPADV